MACAMGQLTAAEFEHAVRLFVGWWQAAASSSSQQLCWSLQSVRMPVTGQVISYAQLERIMPAGSSEQQQLTTAAADHLQALQQQQQQPELEADDDEAAVSFTAALEPATATATAAPADVAAPASAAAAAAADVAASQVPDHAAGLSPQLQRLQQQPLHVHQYSIVYHETYQVPVLYIRASELDGQPLSLSQLLQELPGLQQCREPSQADWTFITQVEHPLLRTPCFMLHPCQTAARMQLLLQQQLSSTQAAAAHGTASPCQEASTEQPIDGSCGSQPALTAAAAAAAAGDSGLERRHSVGGPAGKCDAPLLLLLYMRAWSGMLAGLLGIDMLPFYDA